MGRNIVKRNRFSGYKGFERIGREARRNMKDMQNKPESELKAGYSANEISYRWQVDESYAEKQLAIGTEIEKEHTDDFDEAQRIASHHLFKEGIEYYTKLVEMEKELKVETETQYQKGEEVILSASGSYFLLSVDSVSGERIYGWITREITYPGEEVIALVDSHKSDYPLSDVLGYSKKFETETTFRKAEQEYLDGMVKLFLEFLNLNQQYNISYTEKPQAENPEAMKLVAVIELNDSKEKIYVAINEEDSDNIDIDLPDGKMFSGSTEDAANYVNKNAGKPMTKIVPDKSKEPETPAQMNFKSQLDRINHIKALIDSKGEDLMKYSEAELQLLRTYEGLGGQANKVKDIDVGILDQFYTPYKVIEIMWGLAFKYGFTFTGTKHICEPSCGIGRFFEYIPDGHDVSGYEIDKYAYTIAKLSFPKFNIINQPFESHFWDIKMNIKKPVKPEYDLFIGNPPYRDLDSKYTSMKDVIGRTEKDYTHASTFDQYMLMRGVDLLLPGGLLIFIIPNSFMANDSSYNQFKTSLTSKADLLDAYRLPNGVFPNTKIGTDIVVFKKK